METNDIQTAGCTWMQRNSSTRKTIMKSKKITVMEVEEIKKELQENQRSHLNKSKEEQLEQFCSINAGDLKQNSAPTTEEEMEHHQQRSGISKLKEKIESLYYQMTQIEINKKPRLQKPQNMFKIK